MSITETTNYHLEKIGIGTELDAWGDNLNDNWDKISTQMKLNADAALAATTLANTKAPLAHTHLQADITDLTTDLAGKAPLAHTHTVSQITDAATTLAAYALLAGPTLFTGVGANAPKAETALQGTSTTQVATTAHVYESVTKEQQLAKSGAYTLALGDAGKMVTFSAAAVVTVNSAIFSAGHRVDLLQLGTGAVTVAGSATKRVFPAGANKLAGQYAGATIWFISASEYVLIGNVIV